jgi:hypothetical protein
MTPAAWFLMLTMAATGKIYSVPVPAPSTEAHCKQLGDLKVLDGTARSYTCRARAAQ